MKPEKPHIHCDECERRLVKRAFYRHGEAFCARCAPPKAIEHALNLRPAAPAMFVEVP